MPRRAVVAVVLCLAALAACDSGPSVDPEADEDLIEDALLNADDLPDGFDETDVEDDDDRLGVECNEDVLGIDPEAIDDDTSAETDPVQFDSVEGDLSLRAQITAFEDGGDITSVVEAVSEDDDDYIDCLTETLDDSLDQGTTLIDLEAIESPFEDDDATVGAIRVLLEVTSAASGAAVEIESQQHTVVLDRFAVTLQVTAQTGQIDDALVEELLEAMVERVEDGLDS